MNEVANKIVKLSTYPSDRIGHSASVIVNLLRKNQILGITAPKNSLKTSLAISLALSLSQGTSWLNWQCRQLKVLYVNVNHRENDLLYRMGSFFNDELTRESIDNVDILTLEKGLEITKFTDVIISQVSQSGETYRAIIIDSLDNIVINQFGQSFSQNLTRLINTLNCSVVFTQSHRHNPKGNKEARDMAERSDTLDWCDSMLEFIRLDLDPELLRRERLKAVWELSETVLTTHNENYFLLNVTPSYLKKNTATSEELRSHIEIALEHLPQEQLQGILKSFDDIDLPLKYRTYWRMEVVTSDYPREGYRDYLFYYPHLLEDKEKILVFHEPGLKLKAEFLKENHSATMARDRKRTDKLKSAINDFEDKFDKEPNQKELAEFMSVDRTTIARWAKQSNGEVILVGNSYKITS